MVRIPRIHELPAGEYILPAVPPVHGDIGFQSGLDYEQQKDVCPPYMSSNTFTYDVFLVCAGERCISAYSA